MRSKLLETLYLLTDDSQPTELHNAFATGSVHLVPDMFEIWVKIGTDLCSFTHKYNSIGVFFWQHLGVLVKTHGPCADIVGTVNRMSFEVVYSGRFTFYFDAPYMSSLLYLGGFVGFLFELLGRAPMWLSLLPRLRLFAH